MQYLLHWVFHWNLDGVSLEVRSKSSLFSVCGWLHVKHGFYLVWICLYSMVIDYETQELLCRDSESTHSWV